MTPAEVAHIVESIARSLESDPGQFQVNVTTFSGQTINVSSDGTGGPVTGMSINMTGGGAPGSHMIGNQVNANWENVAVGGPRQQRHEARRDHNVAALVAKLSELVEELRAPEPSKTKLAGLMDVIKAGWVPPLITAIIQPLLEAFRG